jgi:hypothetical protein
MALLSMMDRRTMRQPDQSISFISSTKRNSDNGANAPAAPPAVLLLARVLHLVADMRDIFTESAHGVACSQCQEGNSQCGQSDYFFHEFT